MMFVLYVLKQLITIYQNLRKADLMGGNPDSYVQVALNQSHKELKTKTVKNSQNPAWNEDFRFEVLQKLIQNS